MAPTAFFATVPTPFSESHLVTSSYRRPKRMLIVQ